MEVLQPTELFGGDECGILQWIDDSLLYSRNVEQHLEAMDRFLEQLEKKRLRLNIKKCEFLTTTAVWCGREFSERGWRFSDKYFNKLLETNKPTYKWQMSQFVYLLQWIAPTVPDVAPMKDKLSEQIPNSISAKELKDQNEQYEWTVDLDNLWDKCLATVNEVSKKYLSYYSPDKPLCIFTDASGDYWSCVVTHCINGNPADKNFKLPVKDQIHEPIYFLSGKFAPNQLKWHISAKELWPLIFLFKRLPYIVLGHGDRITLYTDHRNLEHLFNPEKSINAAHLDRLSRWMLTIQQVDLCVRHIKGEDNVAADLLSRWGNPHFEEKQRDLDIEAAMILEELAEKDIDMEKINLNELNVRAMELRSHRKQERQGTGVEQDLDLNEQNIEENSEHEEEIGVQAPELLTRRQKLEQQREKLRKRKEIVELEEALRDERISPLHPYYGKEWQKLDIEQVRIEQEKELKKPVARAIERQGKLWVPQSLITKLVVHNHFAKLHVGVNEEVRSLRSQYSFNLNKEELQLVVRRMHESCLHCHRRPRLIRREMGQTFLTKEPRRILHLDFLFVNKFCKLLVILDNATRKTYLKMCNAEDTETVAEATTEFIGNFMLKQEFTIVTDRPAYFASKLMKDLAKRLNFAHEFAVSYAPWTNGVVESQMKRILKLVKIIGSEYRLFEKDWGKMLGLLLHGLNNFPSEAKGGMTPNELFLGPAAETEPRLVDRNSMILVTEKGTIEPKNYDRVEETFKELRQAMDEKLEQAYEINKLRREVQRLRYLKRHTPVNYQFGIGDWVLISKANTLDERNKTKPVWIGPYRVTSIVANNVYEVEDLLERTWTVHSSRMWFYEGKDYEPSKAVRDLFMLHRGELSVDRIVTVYEEDGEYWVEIKWKGFGDDMNTVQLLKELYEDLPHLVKEHINEKNTKLNRQIKKQMVIWQKEIDEKRLLGVNFLEHRVKGWHHEEKQILRALVMKFGMGRINEMLASERLPGRTKSQIVSQLQKIMHKLSLNEYHHIHLDIFRVGRDNRLKSKKMITSKLGDSMEFIKKKRWLNLWRYGMTIEDIENVRVPYYSRLDTAFERERTLKFLESGGDISEVIPELESRDQAIKKLKLALGEDILTESYRKQVRSWFEDRLTDVQTVLEQIPREYLDIWEEPDVTFCLRKLKLQVKSLGWNKFELARVDELGDSRLYRVTTSFIPPRATVINADVREPEFFRKLRANYFRDSQGPTVVHLDPPWKIASSDPHRGLRLPYDLMTNTELLSLDFDKLQDSGIAFMWVTNATEELARKFFKKFGYKIVEQIVWVKLTKTGKVVRTQGYYTQHSYEKCLMAVKGQGAKFVHKGKVSNIIQEQITGNTRKPRAIYTLIEEVVPNATYLDIFSRNNNLRTNWTSVGLELKFDGVEVLR